MAEPCWILGISIDEEITWCAIAADTNHDKSGADAYPPGEYYFGFIADLSERNIRPKFNISEALSKYFQPTIPSKETLNAISQDDRDHYAIMQTIEEIKSLPGKIVSIGISTIGVTNHRTGRLLNISRKDFYQNPDKNYIVDFRGTLSHLFPKVGRNIFVENDVVAKAIGQHSFIDDLRRDDICCYVNLSEGINIGIVDHKGPVTTSDVNPEYGHIYAPLHADDINFKKVKKSFSGCITHCTCFEGLASAKRFRKQWAEEADLEELGKIIESTPEALDILSFYTAHLCWNAALAVAPKKIIIGGPLCSDGLLRRARNHFRSLNLKYLQYDAIDEDLYGFIDLAKPSFIQQDWPGDLSGLMGALELARVGFRQRGGVHSVS